MKNFLIRIKKHMIIGGRLIKERNSTLNKYIRNKRKEVIASERYIKFIIKHQNKLHRRYYSDNVPKNIN